jgi:hypothetical protein
MATAIVDTFAQIFRGGSAIVQNPYLFFAQVREKALCFAPQSLLTLLQDFPQ